VSERGSRWVRSVLSAANSESAAKSFAVPSTHSAVASRPTPASAVRSGSSAAMPGIGSIACSPLTSPAILVV
jgi:hypothetical protein